MERRLVRVVAACELLALAAACFGVHALDVAPLADLQRRVHEDLYEVLLADHVAHVVACGAVGADGRAQDDAPVPHYFGRNETDPTDVDVPVLLAEAEPLG